MSPEIALYAAAVAAALVGIGSLLKALRASRSQDYELFSDSEGGTGDSEGGTGTNSEGGTGTDSEGGTGTDSEGGTGTDSEGGTGTEDEPPAQQTSVIPLAFSVVLVLYLVLLAQSNPTWQMVMKAAGICYILCLSMIAVWTPIKTGRTVASLILDMWMLGMPFLQCKWWLFGVSIATCTVSAVVLHYADLGHKYHGLKHCFGLAASLIAAWIVALTVLCTWSWASLLLTAPGIFGFFLVALNLKDLEERYVIWRYVPYDIVIYSVFLSLFLIWSMPLPLLTSASWQLLAAVLFAGFGGAALFIVEIVDESSPNSQVPLWVIRRVAAVLVIGTLLPLAVVWWSGEVPQLLETVPPWMLRLMLRLVPVTFGMIYIWMEVVYVWINLEPWEHVIDAFGRTEIMTRVLVLLILLATPWALALDTAQLQQWDQIPNLYLPDYLTLQFGNQTWQNVQTWHFPNATWHGPKENFLHMTQPRWPDLATATNSMARAKFWVPFMVIKFCGATVFAMLVLGMPCSKD